jgi:hypothetical protein
MNNQGESMNDLVPGDEATPEAEVSDSEGDPLGTLKKEALIEGRLIAYLLLHEKSEILDAFFRIRSRGSIKPDEYWALARQTWIASDTIKLNNRPWEKVFSVRIRDRGRFLMNEKERASLAQLPRIVKVYFGLAGSKPSLSEINSGVLSWTMSKRVARNFARTQCELVNQHCELPSMKRRPYVVAGEIEKSKIIAYIGALGMREIIAFPGDVQSRSSELVSKPDFRGRLILERNATGRRTDR